MPSNKVKAAQQVLANHGFHIDDEIVEKALRAANRTPRSEKFPPGTLVWFYEGMGEMGWGNVVEKKQNGYVIEIDGVNEKLTHYVSNTDMRGKATQAEIDEYVRQRKKKSGYY